MSLNIKIVKGDDVLIGFTALDTEEEPINITGATITWGLYSSDLDASNRTNAILTRSGGDITISAPTDGEFNLSLADTDTVNLIPGQFYYHSAVIVDAGGKVISTRNSDGSIGTVEVLL